MSLVGPATAQAAPPPPSSVVAPAATSPGRRAVTLTAAQKSVAKLSWSMYKAAVYHDGERLNYGNAYKVAHGTTAKAKYRRQFAAGFEDAGGVLKNISSAEHKKVRAYEMEANSGANLASRVRPDEGGTNCTGASYTITYDKRENGTGGNYIWAKTWLDSCQTNSMKFHMRTTAAILGAIGAKIVWSIPFTWTVGGFLAFSHDYIDTQQQNSNVNAVWVEDKYGWWTAGPQ